MDALIDAQDTAGAGVALPTTGATDTNGDIIYIDLDVDVYESDPECLTDDEGCCDTSNESCCKTEDSDPDCPQAWEYEDSCDCVTDSDRSDYDSDDHDGCTPCECFPVHLDD